MQPTVKNHHENEELRDQSIKCNALEKRREGSESNKRRQQRAFQRTINVTSTAEHESTQKA